MQFLPASACSRLRLHHATTNVTSTQLCWQRPAAHKRRAVAAAAAAQPEHAAPVQVGVCCGQAATSRVTTVPGRAAAGAHNRRASTRCSAAHTTCEKHNGALKTNPSTPCLCSPNGVKQCSSLLCSGRQAPSVRKQPLQDPTVLMTLSGWWVWVSAGSAQLRD